MFRFWTFRKISIHKRFLFSYEINKALFENRIPFFVNSFHQLIEVHIISKIKRLSFSRDDHFLFEILLNFNVFFSLFISIRSFLILKLPIRRITTKRNQKLAQRNPITAMWMKKKKTIFFLIQPKRNKNNK